MPEVSRPARALLLLAALLILAGIGLRDPWPPDEPRFALVAKTMVETGDWMIPRRGIETYPDKPPLFMWLIAGFYLLTGSIAVAMLLPSALAGLGTLWLVYDLARRLWSEPVGVAALLGLLSAHQFLWQARFAQIDMLVTFWTVLGVYGLLRHCLLGPSWRWYFLGSFAIGLGVISKGVGFLAWLVLPPYLLLAWRGATLPAVGGWGNWRWFAGVAVALIPILAWLLPMLAHVAASGDPALLEYRDNILLKQTAERYLDPWHHYQPFWYLPVSALGLWLPLAGLLPWLLPRWLAAWREREARVLIPLGYLVLVFVFFSISPAKRGVYMLPALPAFVLAAAPYLAELARRQALQRLSQAAAWLLGALLAATALYAGWLRPEQGERWLRHYDLEPWGLVLLFAAMAPLAWWLTRRRQPVLAFPAFYALLTLCWGFLGMPMLDQVRSARPLMLEVTKRQGERPLALIDWREPLALFAQGPVEDFGFRRPPAAQLLDGLGWLRQHPEGLILGNGQILTQAFVLEQEDFLGTNQRDDWYLVGREDLKR